MNNFKTIRADLIQARIHRDQQDNQLHITRTHLCQVERRLNVLRRVGRANAGDPEGAQLLRRKKELEALIQQQENELLEREQFFHRIQKNFVQLPLPQQLVEQLDDRIPFLLVPVRVETKFMKNDAGADELWVRIYPDDIVIETHEKPLTDDEVKVGKAFWEAIWRAGGNTEKELGAWRVLVSVSGAPRAAWIAKTMEPLNNDDEHRPAKEIPDEMPLEPVPEFPEVEPKQGSWTRAPRVRIMPDRFVVSTYVSDKKTHEIIGNQIPDPLIVGPDPLQINGGFSQADGDLHVDPDMEWLTKFQKAVEVGMAVRIPINASEARNGFDRVIVLGLRLSSDERDSKLLLENLLDNHHYTEGLHLIPQGTPTNNTEESGSGFSRIEPGDETSFRVEFGDNLFEPVSEPFEKRDGQRLAEALGVNDEIFQHIHHSDGCDGREAMAMNRALWSATLGYFMEEMMDPVFSLENIRKIRSFFTNFVSGRGFLSAIRVGRQPYGILPTSVFSRWKWSREYDPFFTDLYSVLRHLDKKWTSLSREVTHAGSSSDPDNDLLDILGLHASSVEFYKRFGAGATYLYNLVGFTVEGQSASEWNNKLQAVAADLITELGFDFKTIPKIFKINFFRDHRLLQQPLIDKTPLSETKGIQPITENIGNYIHWLMNNDNTIEVIREQDFGTDENGDYIPRPQALLYLLLRHAFLQQNWDTAIRVHVRENIVTEAARREVELLNMHEHPDVTRWDYFETTIPNVTGELTMAQFLRSDAVITLPEANELLELQSALPVLADLPTARLERLLVEHLDLCSYRLDAWQLGIVNFRLQQLRQENQTGTSGENSEETRPFGIYLGAFSWLEDLRPAPQRQPVPPDEVPEGFDDSGKAPLTYAPNNGGYIHAPSLNHAAAAAILRNAYITHASPDNSKLMSVNLSSERVRHALWYVEGIQNGQELGALLGYQFERGLHERHPELSLNQYILPLRKKFPLVADQVTESPENAPIDAIEARNVVNGLSLVDAARKVDDPRKILDFPASTAEKDAIVVEIGRITAELDAVSDLALAESVFQVAQGNYDRAGAVLKVTSEANRPFETEVVNTPRTGTALTHRVMINFSDDDSTSPHWQGIDPSPMAETEPLLNNWLGQMLGDPVNIRCQVAYQDTILNIENIVEVSLLDLNMQPIDFIYQTGQDLQDEATELENRIAYHVRKTNSLNQTVPLNIRFIERKPEWEPNIKTFFEILPLVNNLREIICGCRPLAADDFILPSDEVIDNENRQRYDLTELQSRANQAHIALEDVKGDEEGTKGLKKAINDLKNIDPIPAILNLCNALLEAAKFNIPDAIPASAEVSTSVKDELLKKADSVLAVMERRFEQARQILETLEGEQQPNSVQLKQITLAFKAIFGRSFNVIPFFTLQNPDELQLAVNHSNTLLNDAPPQFVNEWLQGLTKVRSKISTYHTAIMFADMFEHISTKPIVAQIPFRENDAWAALPIEIDPENFGDKLSLIMQVPDGFQTSGTLSGLLFDEFLEMIPNNNVTTGVAFHLDQPTSEPPQTILLAVTPELTGSWKWQDLLDTLHETLDMAKKRAVEPDKLSDTEYAQLIPAIITAVTKHFTTFSVDLTEVVSL